jgi:acyl-coenzyme A thioesterase PaaI-like protein
MDVRNMDDHAAHHMLLELGLDLWPEDDEQRAVGPVFDAMLLPGTETMRTSVLAVWADTVAGHLVVPRLAPRVPVTLELGVDVYREPVGMHEIHMVGRLAKAGNTVLVATVEFTDRDGGPIAIAHASFMKSPNEALAITTDRLGWRSDTLMPVPFAERAGCTRDEPGVARLPRRADGGNASDTLNGGLIALVAEEAALHATGSHGLSHLMLRYLRPVRVGPAVARAEVVGEVANVEIADEGDGDKLAVLATAHVWH